MIILAIQTSTYIIQVAFEFNIYLILIFTNLKPSYLPGYLETLVNIKINHDNDVDKESSK